MNILVVEDNLETAQLLVRLFSGQGHYVLHKTYALDGLRAARERRFDAMLLGLDLSVDGSPIGSLLRSQLKDIPLVAITEQDDRITRIKAKLFGFDALIAEQWSAKDLLTTVEGVIERRSVQAQANPPSQSISVSPVRATITPTLNA